MVLAFFLINGALLFAQNKQLFEAFKFKSNTNINGFTNNPYKLIQECYFKKTSNNTIIWGYNKFLNNNTFFELSQKTHQVKSLTFELSNFKTKIPETVYNDLMYYGFSEITKTTNNLIISTSNTLLIFNKKDSVFNYSKIAVIPDSIEFNELYAINDSCLILLDYRASFNSHKTIKAYTFDIKTLVLNSFYKNIMASNSTNYDKDNTLFFDVNNKYILITDNLDYKITLLNAKGDELNIFTKDLAISDKSRAVLNPEKLIKGIIDSISKELLLAPRILNTQFLNDTDIIVSYAAKPCIIKAGVKIKNSTLDLLTVRNNKIIYKATYDDVFYYESINFGKSPKIKQDEVNPYLRMEWSYFFQNNQLIKFTYQQLIPQSNTTFEKYIRKAKTSMLSLKSKLIYRSYEFIQ